MEEMIRQYDVPMDASGEDLDGLLSLMPRPLLEHSRRVALCSAAIAGQAGEFADSGLPFNLSLELVTHLGGSCHDIGKLLILDWKRNRARYLLHPEAGALLLDKYRDTLFDSVTQADIVIDIVMHHHERADGRGFPDGRSSLDITLATGICAAADTLDHLLINRPGNPGDCGDVLRHFKRKQGVLFSKTVVLCLERAWPVLMSMYGEWRAYPA